MTDARATCPALLDDISAYLDGELPRPACRRIEAHCAGCAHCARVVEGLGRTIGLCRDAGAAPVPESIRRRACAHVRHLLAAGRERRKP